MKQKNCNKKGLKKQTKKELALLFCSYVFLNEGLKVAGNVKPEDRTENDWQIFNLHKKLKNILPTFLKEEILQYYFTRLLLVKDSQVQMSPLILGLFLYRLYLEFREDTKYLNLGLSKKKVEKLLEDIKKQFHLKEDEVRYAYEFALAFFPDKAGLIQFKKLTNRLFGGEYIKGLYMLEKYEKGYEISEDIKAKAKKYTDELLNKK